MIADVHGLFRSVWGYKGNRSRVLLVKRVSMQKVNNRFISLAWSMTHPEIVTTPACDTNAGDTAGFRPRHGHPVWPLTVSVNSLSENGLGRNTDCGIRACTSPKVSRAYPDMKTTLVAGRASSAC